MQEEFSHNPKKKVSVVICLFNEAENIRPLVLNLQNALSQLDFEVIMVDDGSLDDTVQEIRKNFKPWIKLIQLKKNYGQSSALAAGIDYAQSDYIVTMDGDLQNDPLDIPLMLHKIETGGYDLVVGYRQHRKDNFILRKLPSLLANHLIRKATRVKIKDYGCTLKIFRKDIAKDIRLYGELHRFIPVLASLEGTVQIAQVSVNHHPRLHGISKYGLNRTLKVISDLLLLLFIRKYMQRPMHLFGSTGLLAALAGIIINLYLVALKIAGHDIWGKPLLILGTILVLSGIQLVTIGLFAEILMRTYYESQSRKPYNVKSIITCETISEEVPLVHSKAFV